MTPDLLEQGAQRIEQRRAALQTNRANTESGGRNAGIGRIATPGEVDITHGRILYLEDVSVSFDGFKAINKLSLKVQCHGSSFQSRNTMKSGRLLL